MELERTKEKSRTADDYGVIENGLFKNQQEVFKKIVTESLDSMEAYWAVRETIQKYQQDNRISGIVWKEIAYRGKSVRVPEVHDQLVSVPGDKQILVASTPAILDWWAEVTEGMELWKTVDDDIPIILEEILLSAPLTEWAEVHLWDHPETNIICLETGERWVEARLELKLNLCWGIPENVAYVGHSESGSEWFDATPRNLKYSELEQILNI